MFWGLSPALDLQEEYFKINPEEVSEINILLIGGCDARHIVKTIAKSYKHQEKQINIHIIEGCSELVARQLMLLFVATASSNSLGLQEKARMYMELYGNTLLRYPSSRYMVKLSKVLIKFLTDFSLMQKHWPLISLDRIKYRERDYIEMLLKFWGNGHSNKFDICNLWERRLRNYLGVRYDVRIGVFDWDYNMRFREVGGKTVNLQEYKHFRSNGVAFTWLETEVSRPNYTLAAGVLIDGEKFIHKGYLGDIITGPYVAYGLDCEDESMMKSSNGTHVKRATDLTERNLIRYFYEMEHKAPFNPQMIAGDTDHNLGLVTVAMQDAVISEEPLCDDLQNFIPSFINMDNIKIHFHTFSVLDIYHTNENYTDKFHVVFISNNLSKIIKPTLTKLIKNNGVVIVEGKKFILDLKRDDVKSFGEDVQKMAKEWNCDLLHDYESFKHSWVKMRMKKTSTKNSI